MRIVAAPADETSNGPSEGRESGRDSRADGGAHAAAPRACRLLRGCPPGSCRATAGPPRRSDLRSGSARLALGFCF